MNRKMRAGEVLHNAQTSACWGGCGILGAPSLAELNPEINEAQPAQIPPRAAWPRGHLKHARIYTTVTDATV